MSEKSDSQWARIVDSYEEMTDDLLLVVAACGERFREYEAQHRAKIQPPDRGDVEEIWERRNRDATAKAERNRDMAEMCEKAIAKVEGLRNER